MPTFTAVALDRFLEPGTSKSVDMSVPSSKPMPNPKLQRRNSTSAAERKVPRPQLKPALYATPEITRLPDSPSSFSPSPYIINHKRRGPSLIKSSSEANLTSDKRASDDEEVNGKAKNVDAAGVNSGNEASVDCNDTKLIDGGVNGVHECDASKIDSDVGNGNEEIATISTALEKTREDHSSKTVASKSERVRESEDFFDLQDSLIFTSNTDGEDNALTESALKRTTPAAEFYDAWEELSSEGGNQSSLYDMEAELCEIRMSFLMEIEKRKQAEEALNNLRSQWERIRQQLSNAGLTFSADPTTVAENEQVDFSTSEDLSQQVFLARFVSDAIGRGTARAEAEIEMEAQIESKNFEIARLWDRLNFYETVNREMSQRNQEAVEMARRERQRRKKKQKWIWGSIAAAITLGTAAIAWSYFPVGRGSPSTNHFEAQEHDVNIA